MDFIICCLQERPRDVGIKQKEIGPHFHVGEIL